MGDCASLTASWFLSCWGVAPKLSLEFFPGLPATRFPDDGLQTGRSLQSSNSSVEGPLEVGGHPPGRFVHWRRVVGCVWCLRFRWKANREGVP